MGDFVVKDSGARQDYESGMRRDVETGKVDYTLIFDGPMLDRYAAHLTKGAAKYGPRNWTLAASHEEAKRFKRSAARHFFQWMRGEDDEDHAAAVVFNINAFEYVMERLSIGQAVRQELDKELDRLEAFDRMGEIVREQGKFFEL